MDAGRMEALATARKLVRTLDSAPNPQQQAQAAVAALLRAGGWSPATRRRIVELAHWLSKRPPPVALKGQCQAVLKTLD